jgi:hypothetical protein
VKLILEIIVPHFDNEDDGLEGIIVIWYWEDKSAESPV